MAPRHFQPAEIDEVRLNRVELSIRELDEMIVLEGPASAAQLAGDSPQFASAIERALAAHPLVESAPASRRERPKAKPDGDGS